MSRPTPIDREGIGTLIPHREPFLFLDRIDEVRPGRYARGVKHVAADESYLKGHFPGSPIVPGVLIIEALGQLACALLRLSSGEWSDDARLASTRIGYLARADVRFLKVVRPGDTLILEVRRVGAVKNFVVLRVRGLVGAAVVAEGRISVVDAEDRR